jgi:hypothetical protein
MRDPVTMRDTHTYERAAIAEWLARKPVSPFDRTLTLTMKKALVNLTLKQAIDEFLERFTFPVAVKSKCGRTITVIMKLTDKIIDLKEKVRAQTGESVGGMEFFYGDKALEDEQTVEDYDFQTGAIVHEPFLVSVKSKIGRTINVTLKLTNKVIDLKEKVSAQTGECAEHMRFIYDGRRLDNDQTAEDYRIKPGAIVREPFQVFCGGETSDKMVIIHDLVLDDSVETLSQKMSEKTGIPVGLARLMCQGKQLVAGKKLEDYGIGNDATVYQLFRLLGGAAASD